MSTPTHAGETVDLKAIFRKLTAKWWLFMLCVAIALGLAYAYLKTTPKSYKVQAVMLMSEESRNAFGGGQEDFIKGMSFLRNNAELEDLVAVLTSRANMLKTLKKLDFAVSYYEKRNFLTQEKYEYPPFFVKPDSGMLQVIDVPIHVKVDTANRTFRVKGEGQHVRLYNTRTQTVVDDYLDLWSIDQEGRMGQPFIGDHLAFQIEFPADRRYAKDADHFFVIHSLDGLVQDWRGLTTAEPLSDESNIVLLSTQGEVVEKHTNFLNKLMDTYIEGELYKRQQKGLKTINFIDDQLGSAKDTLTQAEEAMKRAQSVSGVISGAAARSDALFEDRSRLLDEQGRIQSMLQYFNYILEYMRNNDEGTPMAPSASNIDAPVLNNLIIDYINDANTRAQLNLTNKKPTPQTIALDRKLQSGRAAIMETAAGLLEQARLDLAQVNGRLGSIGAMFSQLPENTRKLSIAQRRVDLSSDLFNYLMEKRAEAGIAIASDQVDKSVVDEARMEGVGPMAPDVKVVFGGALLLGLLLPLAFILVRDFFNDKIADIDELKRLSAIPVLSTIPSSKRKRVMPDEPKSLLAESFRTARINLQYLNPGAQKQVIGFTSSTSGEGKTFCALNLATVLALSGKRTVLIDADMRRPRVAETLAMAEGDGLSTFLIGEAEMDDIVRRTDIQGLDAITAGPLPPNPLELVETPRMTELFQSLRSRYDQIVVDASPMGLVSEYVILMRHLDVTLYVVRQGYTRRSALRLVNEMFTEKKVQHVDLLLNDVKAGPGYGAGYGYYVQ